MKFIKKFYVSLVASNTIPQSVNRTESEQLVSSIQNAIQKYLGKRNQTQENLILPQSVSQVAPISKIITEAEARKFINYAGAAYCSKDKLLNWSCANCNGYAAGSNNVSYFTNAITDTAGYLTVNNAQKMIVLGYRGTQSIVNWLFNLDTQLSPANLPAPYADAQIHSGFYNMMNSLLQPTTNVLKKAMGKYPGYKIVFTGHSLGGALATLTAYSLLQSGLLTWDKVSVITYGQPRVGNAEFADFLNSKPWTQTRVTAYSDIIAVSPGITAGFSHNQYNMHINKEGVTIKCSIYEEDEKCISDFLIPNVDAHFTYWDQRINSDC